MVRSGSTLQYNIVRNLIISKNAGQAVGRIADHHNHIQRNISKWKDANEYYLMRSHYIQPWTENLLMLRRKRLCYIYRDIRDVAVSLKHISKQKRIRQELFRIKNIVPIDYLKRMVLTYYRVKEFKEKGYEVLVQQYEAVVKNLPDAISEVAEFLDLNVCDHEIEFVNHECSLEKATSITKQLAIGPKSKLCSILGLLSARFRFAAERDEQSLLSYNHISKNRGATGVWRMGLTDKEIEAILHEFGDWLCETGYM